MVRIAPVNLQYNPKTLWFDAGSLEASVHDGLIVRTARGVEFGRLAQDIFEADESRTKKLKSPLKPVVRVATEDDLAKVEELNRKSREALPLFKEVAAASNTEMHPVSVEYLFDGAHAVCYFESENRIDFREIVRTLSSKLRVRIDMRQIGVRDEARMVGGIGHCGQELCCARLGGEFCPVSIRMAKEQDLSLNPQKISGVCGRLMCCLRYEFEAYKDFKGRAPKKNAQVSTPDGPAKVVSLDVPREVVSVCVEGEKPVKVPLSGFDPPQEGSRPKSIGEEAWEDAQAGSSPREPSLNLFGTSSLTEPDVLAESGSVRHTGAGKRRDDEGRGKRSQTGQRRGRGKQQRSHDEEASVRKPRRRRSTKVSGGDHREEAESRAPEQHRKKRGQGSSDKQRQGQAQGKRNQAQGKQGHGQQAKHREGSRDQRQARPGQRSSGLRRQRQSGQLDQPGQGRSAGRPEEGRRHASGRSEEGQLHAEGQQPHRRSRHRRHGAEGLRGEGQGGGRNPGSDEGRGPNRPGQGASHE